MRSLEKSEVSEEMARKAEFYQGRVNKNDLQSKKFNFVLKV